MLAMSGSNSGRLAGPSGATRVTWSSYATRANSSVGARRSTRNAPHRLVALDVPGHRPGPVHHQGQVKRRPPPLVGVSPISGQCRRRVIPTFARSSVSSRTLRAPGPGRALQHFYPLQPPARQVRLDAVLRGLSGGTRSAPFFLQLPSLERAPYLQTELSKDFGHILN